MDRLRILTAASLALALAAPVGALTIDNFNEGVVNVLDNSDSPTQVATFGENAGLANPNTVGGVRLTSVRADPVAVVALPGNALAQSVPGPAGAVTLTSTIQGNFNIFYDGIADGVPQTTDGGLFLDLSGHDAFAVDMVVVDATLLDGNTPQFRITVWTGSTTKNALFRDAVTGLNIIEFSEFGAVNWSDVRALRIAVTEVFTGDSVVINDFSAIPEPGTALLLGAGLVGLAARRRLVR